MHWKTPIIIILSLIILPVSLSAQETEKNDESLTATVIDDVETVETPSIETVEEQAPEEQPAEATVTPKKKETKIDITDHTIFNDQMLLDGYSEKYSDFSKQILLEMIQDDTLSSYKSAAAVRVFRERFGEEVVSKEKKRVIKMLLRRLNRTTSPFVQVEIMYTLNYLDRYRYFKSMVPALIRKLSHYNETVNLLAFNYLEKITLTSTYRAREANIVFVTLRKVLFLSRKRLASIEEPDERLSRKLKILRWSIKVLGNEKLKKLPKEVLGLL